MCISKYAGGDGHEGNRLMCSVGRIFFPEIIFWIIDLRTECALLSVPGADMSKAGSDSLAKLWLHVQRYVCMYIYIYIYISDHVKWVAVWDWIMFANRSFELLFFFYPEFVCKIRRRVRDVLHHDRVWLWLRMLAHHRATLKYDYMTYKLRMKMCMSRSSTIMHEVYLGVTD